jgi:hypothetical protein
MILTATVTTYLFPKHPDAASTPAVEAEHVLVGAVEIPGDGEGVRA